MARAYELEGWLERPIRRRKWEYNDYCYYDACSKEWRYNSPEMNTRLNNNNYDLLFSQDDWELYVPEKKKIKKRFQLMHKGLAWGSYDNFNEALDQLKISESGEYRIDEIYIVKEENNESV